MPACQPLGALHKLVNHSFAKGLLSLQHKPCRADLLTVSLTYRGLSYTCKQLNLPTTTAPAYLKTTLCLSVHDER